MLAGPFMQSLQSPKHHRYIHQMLTENTEKDFSYGSQFDICGENSQSQD